MIRAAVMLWLSLSVLTGLAYPVLVTVSAQTLFPKQANGSLIERNGRLLGSVHIGQFFSADRYFWGRPSATTRPYDAAASSGSNLGPNHPALHQAVAERLAKLRPAGETAPVPVDLLTSSGSGLDPHISPAAAYYQVSRVSKSRGLDPEWVKTLVGLHVEERTLGLLGEARVNVLRLNLALDKLGPTVTATQAQP